MTRVPGGTAGTRSVNVLRRHDAFPHFSRRFTQYRATGSPARRTSAGHVATVPCTLEDTVPPSGHAAAPPQPATAHTSTAPSGPGPTRPEPGSLPARGPGAAR
jgi:hypothetical protein